MQGAHCNTRVCWADWVRHGGFLGGHIICVACATWHSVPHACATIVADLAATESATRKLATSQCRHCDLFRNKAQQDASLVLPCPALVQERFCTLTVHIRCWTRTFTTRASDVDITRRRHPSRRASPAGVSTGGPEGRVIGEALSDLLAKLVSNDSTY